MFFLKRIRDNGKFIHNIRHENPASGSGHPHRLPQRSKLVLFLMQMIHRPKQQGYVKGIIGKFFQIHCISLICMHSCTLLFQASQIMLYQFHGRHIEPFLCQRYAVSSGSRPDIKDMDFLFCTFFHNFIQTLMDIMHACHKFHPAVSAVQTLLFIKFIIIGF